PDSRSAPCVPWHRIAIVVSRLRKWNRWRVSTEVPRFCCCARNRRRSARPHPLPRWDRPPRWPSRRLVTEPRGEGPTAGDTVAGPQPARGDAADAGRVATRAGTRQALLVGAGDDFLVAGIARSHGAGQRLPAWAG